LLCRDSADVTSANFPTRNVNLTLPIARIVLILKAELFLRTTTDLEASPYYGSFAAGFGQAAEQLGSAEDSQSPGRRGAHRPTV